MAWRFALLLVQLGLVLLVLDRYHLADGIGLNRLFPLIFGGFIVHSLVPRRWRIRLFVALTLVGIILVFGATKGSWLIGISLLLIGLCHLPVPFALRVGLVLAAAGGLALVHAGVVEATDAFRYIIPILGTIFMFRLALYLYDLRHERGAVSPWQRLAYFFLLPNPVFPLFPVVDYKTFLRSYYARDAFTIYGKGVLWMARGAVHLLLYRLVYYYAVPTYEEIDSLSGVALFAVTAYLIYLRVSGVFHLAIGILCLFGFDLPETHKRYLLASGFNDYWRRINIYWKDFMTKMVFYPTFMRARKLGHVPGLVVATAVVFLLTWLLHSYQHFWLQGGFPITLVDGLFWGIFGLLVIINTVHEARRPPARRPSGLGSGKAPWNPRAALRLSVQTAAMFVLMCLLWSMWTSPSLGVWTSIMAQSANNVAGGLGLILGVLALGIGGGTLAQYLHHRGWRFEAKESDRPARMALATLVPMVLALALYQPVVHNTVGAKAVVKSLRGGLLNLRDQKTLERGYYEGLFAPNNMTSALWEAKFGAQPDEERNIRLLDPELVRPTNDLLFREYLPNLEREERGTRWTTNRWGLRDQDYELEKPAGTVRIAILGASYTMGKRVNDGENFESRLEILLNETAPEGTRYEILNFAVDAYSPVEGVLLCRDKIARFQPDYMFYVEHGGARYRISERLAERMISGVDLEFDYLEDLSHKARAYPGIAQTDANRSLYARSVETLGWAYGEMARLCREQGIRPVFFLLPRTKENNTPEDLAEIIGIARKAGMTAFLIDDPYQGRDPKDLTVSQRDFHPNALGHRLISERLYDLLEKNESDLKLGITRPRSESKDTGSE